MSSKASPGRSSQRGGPDITAVSVCGYKSISREQRIDIAPLTILAGANSSGKSSIMQPLLLLKQTLEAPYDPGPLKLDGPNVRFTSAEQLFSKAPGTSCANAFSVRIETRKQHAFEWKFRRAAKHGIDIESLIYRQRDGTARKIYQGMPAEEVERNVPSGTREIFEKHLPRGNRKWTWGVFRDRCFLLAGLRPEGKADEEVVLGWPFPFWESVPVIEPLIHVPGLRGNPERTYRITAVEQRFPGTFENYVASIVNHWQTENHSENLKALGQALEHLGLTWKVEAKRLDDTQVELRVGRLPHSRRGGAHDLVSIADVGFGVSQSLPVVVALLVAERGDIVYLEQPEIHLHPSAQVRMAKLLADAAKRGVRVVAETHSALVLTGVQTLVANGELRPNLVRLYWFKRSEKDGSTEVTSGELDQNGAFGDWPEDFDDVALHSTQEYLDAVEKRSVKS